MIHSRVFISAGDKSKTPGKSLDKKKKKKKKSKKFKKIKKEKKKE